MTRGERIIPDVAARVAASQSGMIAMIGLLNGDVVFQARGRGRISVE